MATQDLAVLRTAKQAMGEGLIGQEDFDQIKTAFLRAQQIKAGLDAGFIREEDYVQVGRAVTMSCLSHFLPCSGQT